MKHNARWILLARIMLVASLARSASLLAADQPAATQPSAVAGQADLRDDASPWGIGSSAEWAGEYPKFNPLVSQAGAGGVRLFPEWQVVHPRPGEWNWKIADAMVANARENHLHLTGFFGYFAPWASAKGDTRRLPIKNLTFC